MYVLCKRCRWQQYPSISLIISAAEKNSNGEQCARPGPGWLISRRSGLGGRLAGQIAEARGKGHDDELGTDELGTGNPTISLDCQHAAEISADASKIQNGKDRLMWTGAVCSWPVIILLAEVAS